MPATPRCGNSVGDPTEALGSLWYHDHHLDFTAQNVYKGMFGCYNLFDDTGHRRRGTGLRLPSGDYDIPIFFNDFLFDRDCQSVSTCSTSMAFWATGSAPTARSSRT